MSINHASHRSDVVKALADSKGYPVLRHVADADGTGTTRLSMPHKCAVDVHAYSDGTCLVATLLGENFEIPLHKFEVASPVDALQAVAALRWAMTNCG